MADAQKKKADLKDLDLATGVDRLPELWNRYGNQILIGFTVIALGYALYTFRKNTNDAARDGAERSMSAAREVLSELQNARLDAATADQYAGYRKAQFLDAATQLSDVLGRSDDPDQQRQALLMQGDLNYTVAMLPDPREAATRPTLRLDTSPEKLFAAARLSYQAVVDRFPAYPREVNAARLGLAAVAENEGDFDAAKKLYDTVAADPKAPEVYRNAARARLEILPDLARPIQLRSSTQPAVPSPAPFSLPEVPSGNILTPPPSTPSAPPATTRP